MQLLQSMMSSMYGGDYTSYFDQFGSYYSAMDVWQEMLPGEDGEPISDLVKTQYDMLYGHWPENYDEVVLFVDKNNEISDLVMYAMGLKTESEMEDAMNAAMNQEQVDTTQESWTYEDLCSRTFSSSSPMRPTAATRPPARIPTSRPPTPAWITSTAPTTSARR